MNGTIDVTLEVVVKVKDDGRPVKEIMDSVADNVTEILREAEVSASILPTEWSYGV